MQIFKGCTINLIGFQRIYYHYAYLEDLKNKQHNKTSFLLKIFIFQTFD